MYCPSCGSEISVELKYCNRCGANLSAVPQSYPAPVKPMRLSLPAIVLGLTVVGGLGIIFDGAKDLAQIQFSSVAITWMVLFGLATLFGCTALILRFWLKVFSMNRESYQPQNQLRPRGQMATPQISTPGSQPQLQPRFEAMPSVTEHTTRTFSPAYRERSDPEPR